jgi:glycosyltransferase involved in cell wall biosynthesis
VLKLADKCIAALATDVLVDSPSQRNFLIREGVLKTGHSSVLGAGSISGVDVERFHPSKEVRQKVRKEMGTPNDALVCLYLGRLNRDKGVLDLAAAFARVSVKNPNAELWVVGPDEGDFFLQMQVILGENNKQVRRLGYTSEPERFMQAADLFCLPSYREGFGSSVIESAACALPSLTSRIYGLSDALLEGQTGWMHEPGNVDDLTQRLDCLFKNPENLARVGNAARMHAKQFFEQSLITSEMVNFYRKKYEVQ